MEEIKPDLEAEPKGAELTSSQQAIKALADEMLDLRSGPHRTNEVLFTVGLPAEEVETRLKDSQLADLMLNEGDSLASDPPNAYWTDLDLYIGRAKIYRSEIQGWGWNYGSDGNSISRQTDDGRELLIGNWGRQIDVRLWYSNGDQAAAQRLGVRTWMHAAGSVPHIYRDCIAPAYAEMGYGGHNATGRDASDEEVLSFVCLLRELFEARILKIRQGIIKSTK